MICRDKINRFRTTILALALLGCAWQSDLLAFEPAPLPLTPASPESQGMDGNRLQQAVAAIDAGTYGDMNALLVLRNNYLVLEHYASPQYYGRDYRHSAKSITKSVTSAVVGIARGQDRLPALDTRLTKLLPQYPDLIKLDPRKQQIELQHLLSMSAGFDWDELSPGDNNETQMMRSRDWIRYTLEQPMRDQPGTRLEYNGGCSMILSAVLQDAIDGSVIDFAREFLFEPIGMENWSWSLTNVDKTNTVTGMAMSRRDMARFGVLYLNRGNWLGRQVIPADWIDLSTAAQVLGQGAYYPFAYGYQWWRMQDQEPTAAMLETNDAYFALGFGGQFVMVIPHLQMVVVSTAANHGEDEFLFLQLLREHVIPAIQL